IHPSHPAHTISVTQANSLAAQESGVHIELRKRNFSSKHHRFRKLYTCGLGGLHAPEFRHELQMPLPSLGNKGTVETSRCVAVRVHQPSLLSSLDSNQSGMPTLPVD